MPRALYVRKGAPEKPPASTIWHTRHDEETCISPSLWGMYPNNPNHHGKFRCSSTGSIKTNKGLLCVTHAKVWARRGWINVDQLRTILEARAVEKAKSAAKRVKCLRAGDCL